MFLLSGIETSLLYMTTPTNDTPHGCRMIGPYRFYNCFSSQENTLIHLIKTMLNRGRSRNNVFSQFFFSLKRPFIVPQRPLFMLSIVFSVFSYFLAFVLRCSFLFFSFSSDSHGVSDKSLLPYKNHLPRLFFASEDSRVFSL